MVGPSISGMMTSETIRSICRRALDDPERVDAGRRLEHRVAARGQRARGESAHRLFVLDQQDRAAAGEIGGGLGRLLLRRLDARLGI